VFRGNHRGRTITALVVAGLATVASARLFILDPDDADQSTIAQNYVAGRIDNEMVEAVDTPDPAPEPVTITLTLERSASVDDYLQDAGLDAAAATHWGSFFEKTAATRRLDQGHALTLQRDPETGELRGLRYNLDDRIAITEETAGDGVIHATQEPIRYSLHPVVMSFRVRSDFWHEAERNALPKPILATLEYAFQGRRELRDLPRGSDVRLIYQEKVSRDGSARVVTGLQAAQISYSGRTLSAFAFRDERGEVHLYDADGEALGPQALRFPLNFEYISSGFEEMRFHPILHQYRPHLGIDLTARYGTPVRAVADGRIEQAGWCGELGRCVRIEHAGGIVSIYGHLSTITPGLVAGSEVRVEQVIGRVGTSGLSTGPHLHYALVKDGRYVNPLTLSLNAPHRISPRMRVVFDRFKLNYLTLMSHLSTFGPTIRMARGSAPSVPSVAEHAGLQRTAAEPDIIAGHVTR
jgi:murein DD-endopeptidase MepM/ murein hydrolase activator NlpD